MEFKYFNNNDRVQQEQQAKLIGSLVPLFLSLCSDLLIVLLISHDIGCLKIETLGTGVNSFLLPCDPAALMAVDRWAEEAG